MGEFLGMRALYADDRDLVLGRVSRIAAEVIELHWVAMRRDVLIRARVFETRCFGVDLSGSKY